MKRIEDQFYHLRLDEQSIDELNEIFHLKKEFERGPSKAEIIRKSISFYLNYLKSERG